MIGRMSEPSVRDAHTSQVSPTPGAAKVIHVPSGEKPDERTLSPGVLMLRRPFPFGWTSVSCVEPLPSSRSACVRKAIHLPFGDQTGWSPAASASDVSRRGVPCPFEETTNSARPSCLASGDHWRS